MADIIPKLETVARKILRQRAQLFLEELEKITKQQLTLTIAYTEPRDGRFEEGFKGARPSKSISKITNKPYGYDLKLHIYMADGNGNMHPIWHFVSGGTANRTLTKPLYFSIRAGTNTKGTYPPPKSYKGRLIAFIEAQKQYNRTLGKVHQSNYTSKPFLGYGARIYMPAGKPMKGIKARHFYLRIAKAIAKALENNELGDVKITARETKGKEESYG